MYCPVCGIESTQGLNYCKRCGTNLMAAPPVEDTRQTARVTGMAFAVAVASIAAASAIVALGGLGLVLSFVENVSRQPNAGDLPSLILILGLMMASTLAGLLIWQLSRLIGTFRSSGVQSLRKPVASGFVVPKIAAAPHATSVTEHTTRNFEPARYMEVKGNEQAD